MTTEKNVTAPQAGLSALQRRILVYARQRMVEQDQNINQPKTDEVDIHIVAPDWLARAVFEMTEQVMRTRKTYFRDGELVNFGHPTIMIFEEMFWAQNYITKAANAAGHRGLVDLSKLYRLSDKKEFVLLLSILPTPRTEEGLLYHPWPEWHRDRMTFRVTMKGFDEARVRRELAQTNITLDDDTGWIDVPGQPLNCSIAEMLRDLYNFPVRERGHIDGLAFDPEAIGKAVYNKANAACAAPASRLGQRGLIGIYKAQSPGFYYLHYTRSGIGLTEVGVEVADRLRVPSMAGIPAGGYNLSYDEVL